MIKKKKKTKFKLKFWIISIVCKIPINISWPPRFNATGALIFSMLSWHRIFMKVFSDALINYLNLHTPMIRKNMYSSFLEAFLHSWKPQILGVCVYFVHFWYFLGFFIRKHVIQVFQIGCNRSSLLFKVNMTQALAKTSIPFSDAKGNERLS